MYMLKEKELEFKGLSIKNNEIYNKLEGEIQKIEGRPMPNKLARELMEFLSKVYFIKENENEDLYAYFDEIDILISDLLCLFLNINIEFTEESLDKMYNTATVKSKNLDNKMQNYKTKMTKR